MLILQPDFPHLYLSPTAIMHCMTLLAENKISGNSYFFVVFTPQICRIGFPSPPGYDAVFFVGNDNLSVSSWDIVLYECEGHQPIACILWREKLGNDL